MEKLYRTCKIIRTKQGGLNESTHIIFSGSRRGPIRITNIILDASMIMAGYYQAHESQPEEATEELEQPVQEQSVEVADVPEG